ncbi:MAG: hypothetical protein CBC71_10120, partial [Rhodobacteraceae bacterium TMED111]
RGREVFPQKPSGRFQSGPASTDEIARKSADAHRLAETPREGNAADIPMIQEAARSRNQTHRNTRQTPE